MGWAGAAVFSGLILGEDSLLTSIKVFTTWVSREADSCEKKEMAPSSDTSVIS